MMKIYIVTKFVFPCSTFELWWGAAPYFVDMSVDEPTVVRVSPLRSISPEWGVENIFHRFLFPGGVHAKYIFHDMK